MTPYEKEGYIKSLLFDFVLIENIIYSLLRSEICVDNKIVNSYFE